MKQLFLSHYNRHAGEVGVLARELRFRGLRPWVDKQGGFLIADESASAAETAICEDCLGFLLYATEDVFDRQFIKEHEVPPALRMKGLDETYLLFAVPRGIDFRYLQERSEAAYGVDLSQFHTRPVTGDIGALASAFALIGADICGKILQTSKLGPDGAVSIQFSTRELAPAASNDVFTFDGTEAYVDPVHGAVFDAFIAGLRDSKRALAARFGRPRLRVHGFKHLSAAFLFGRVFQPFEIAVRQTPGEYWSLDGKADAAPILKTESVEAEAASNLVVQISSRFKDLSPAVDKAMTGIPFNRLVLRPIEPPLDVNEALCAVMIRDCYNAIENEICTRPVGRIHLFSAAPQAVMMGLGRRFAGMPEALVYDFDGIKYTPPKTIPGGVL